MSRSIPRMAWRLCTSSSLARRYYTLNGSPACNSAPPMNPARRNAAAMEPACNNAPATYPPAARTPRQRARTRNAHAGRPHVPHTPHACATHATRTRPRARMPPAAGASPAQQKKRRHPQGVTAPQSVTQASARTCRGSRERTARRARRPRTEQYQAQAGRTSSYCQPCS